MQNTDITASWPAHARNAYLQCNVWFETIADETKCGPLDTTPKWGQPSWRPLRPRTGSTLRLNWSPKAPNALMIHVDCKTTLAATIADLYPEISNDRSRALSLDLTQPLPEGPLCHLAALTFTYHRS